MTGSVQEDPKVLCCDVLLLLNLEACDLHPRSSALMQPARSRKVHITVFVVFVRRNMFSLYSCYTLKYKFSVSGLGAHGCAQFLAQQVLLGDDNAGILQSDPPFWKSVAGDHIPPQNEKACMLRSESLGRRRQLRTQ
jgi:hypothetical protein